MCSSFADFLAGDGSSPSIIDVEKIRSHYVENGTMQFLVVPKNWDTKFNIWIPLEKFASLKLVSEYCKRKNISLPVLSSSQRATKLFQSLSSAPDDLLNTICEQFASTSKDELELPQSNREELFRQIEQVVDDEKLQSDEKFMTELRRQVLIERIIERRAEQLRKLREQEWAINSSSDNTEAIRVTNNRDLEVLPEHFKYVNNYVIISPNVILEEISESNRHEYACTEPHKNNLCTKNCICKKSFSDKSSYDKNGRIVSRGKGKRISGIHECNKFCSCGPACRNRVVQQGCKIKIEIFRSATGTGWAVRSLEKKIPAGTFVGKYVGHVIRWTDGELLSTSQTDGNYLFDLNKRKEKSDDTDEHQKYTVDAYEYGNFTRFINHSCSPNLTSIRVWINNLNRHLPEMAFFANRTILGEEELTIDYRDKRLLHDCKCGSKRCLPSSSEDSS